MAQGYFGVSFEALGICLANFCPHSIIPVTSIQIRSTPQQAVNSHKILVKALGKSPGLGTCIKWSVGQSPKMTGFYKFDSQRTPQESVQLKSLKRFYSFIQIEARREAPSGVSL